MIFCIITLLRTYRSVCVIISKKALKSIPLHNLCKGIFIMADNKSIQPYSIVCEHNSLTVKGVKQVVEVTEREAQFKLASNMLIVKGGGLNITRLDKDQGVVVIDYASLSSLSFRQNGINIKGLFR